MHSDILDTIEEISTGLITMLQTFMDEHPYFSTNPFYIFGQSCGRKLAVALAYYLLKAVESGSMQCDMK